MNICVYGASSNLIADIYISACEDLGRKIAKDGHTLIFGCGAAGVMGASARGAKEAGGEIIGITPEFFNVDGMLYEDCDQVIRTETMRERKRILEEKSDAFIVAPGGIGTFDEFFEILTLKQLKRHNKAMVIFNVRGYYDALTDMMDNAVQEGFVAEKNLELYKVSENADGILDYLERYEETDFEIEEVRNLKGEK